MAISETACELCVQPGGDILHRNEKLRVVLVDDAGYPGFCRVIWNQHAREMTDLAEAERIRLMQAVWHVEAALRDIMQPDKINIASLGNMVPHLHWHVIPRYSDDAHFPGPIWGQVRRAVKDAVLVSRMARLPPLRQNIIRRLEAS